MSLSFRDSMRADHRRLAQIEEDLGEAAAAGADARELGEIWTRFAESMRRHFDVEEQVVFPVLERAHPDEVRALRAEHDGLRARLDRMGIDVDLHTVRSDAIRRLLDALADHAHREDDGAYVWAEQVLSLGEKRRVWRRLGHLVAPPHPEIGLGG